MRYPLFILMILILASCAFQPRLAPDRWECVDRDVDSATNRLESMFLGYGHPDSVVALIGMLDSVAASSGQADMKDIVRARVWFWKGRLAYRSNFEDSAVACFDRGLDYVDSGRYPYTFWKLRFEREKTASLSDVADIYAIQKAYDYFKKVDDKPMQATVNVTVGNILSFAGQPRLAIDYFHTADSLYRILGYTDYIVKNRLNLARVLNLAGMSDSAYRIIKDLSNDSVVRHDFLTYNTVLRNMYVDFGDEKALHEAYMMVREQPDYVDLKALYEALLSETHNRRGDTDSADFYSHRAFMAIDDVSIPSYKSVIWRMESRRHERAGRYDSALYCRDRAEIMEDSSLRVANRDEVGYAQYYHDMSRIRNEKERDREMYLLLIAMIVLMAMAAGGVVWIIFTKKRQRLNLQVERERTRLVESELERERAGRRVMALSLAKEETEKIMDNVKEAVDTLYKNERISREDAASLRSNLCDYALQASDWNNFEELFKSSNPHFVPRLFERCPGLTPMQVKLASLTLIGMSIKQIASYLNVKSESVMQARWRLRNRLRLADDESLEAALHRLNESGATATD